MILRIFLFWFVLCLLCSGCSDSNQNAGIKMGDAVQGNALSLSQTVSTFVGSPTGRDGIGSEARFLGPQGITTDGTNLYITDSDFTIRKVEIATGEVKTLVGTPNISGSADGTGAAASFSNLNGIVTDGTNLYVADGTTIRKIVIATRAVTTLAGKPMSSNPPLDGLGADARFGAITAMATDGTSIYVIDNNLSPINNSNIVRKVVIGTGAVTTLVRDQIGTPGEPVYLNGIATNGASLFVAGAVSGTAPGFICKIDLATSIITDQNLITGSHHSGIFPLGMVAVGADVLFVDSVSKAIYKMGTDTGLVTTLAGGGGVTGSVDGIGTSAGFYRPWQITSDGTNIYLIDNKAIRQVSIGPGVVTTLAGNSSYTGDGTRSSARFRLPLDITSDGSNLYVFDTGAIRKIVIATGAVTTLAGSAKLGTADGIGASASFLGVDTRIAVSGANLYVSDTDRIRKVEIATGVVTTLAGGSGTPCFSRISGITSDGTNLYVCDASKNTILKVVIATGAVSTLAGNAGVRGSADGTGIDALFNWPEGITTDGTNLYVTDSDNATVRKVIIASGAVTTLAGSASSYGAKDGIGASASFFDPHGITTDGINLYLTDFGRIRKIEILSGVVSTVAGNNSYFVPYKDGVGALASFGCNFGITTDGKNLFVTDYFSIRKID